MVVYVKWSLQVPFQDHFTYTTMPLYRRFVQVGRVVLIQRGPDEGKLAVIIDVIDQNRAFIDGPANLTGVKRQSISFKNLALTDIVIEIPRGVRQKTLAAAFEKADVVGQWEKTSWAKTRAARAVRANSTDFDRFKITVAKGKRNFLIKQEARKLAKAGSK
eukprot:TRINITY_DN10598_c0_g1_i1.p3 TRINITY_DN10598_c0_g1~~TRINITY_DN10598_c0_g1_i1.p3  ORF type:complete len:161 (+),score=46.87 TRINITY_DN10598_c0_g1_i1:457-939(+)